MTTAGSAEGRLGTERTTREIRYPVVELHFRRKDCGWRRFCGGIPGPKDCWGREAEIRPPPRAPTLEPETAAEETTREERAKDPRNRTGDRIRQG